MATLTTHSGTSGSNAAPVKSAMRTLDIIEYVVARPSGVIAQDIAQALAIPVSSLSYLLSTLVERGYLARVGRNYQAGAGLERLRSTPQRLPLIERVRPLVRALRIQSNETASYFVQREWEIEALITETAEHTLRYSIGVGTRTPMHCLAAGKAMLAAMGPATLDRYFEESVRSRYTETTIVDEARLRAELDTARQSGIAITREEFTPGIMGIGKVLVLDGEVIGSLAVAIPTVRCDAKVEASARTLLEMATLPV